MSIEHSPGLEIVLSREQKWPFIDSQEDSSVISIRLEEGWEGISNDFFTLLFSFNDGGKYLVTGTAKSVLLTKLTTGQTECIGYLNEDDNFTYKEENLPVKLMDRLTRKIFTIKSNRNPQAEAPVGAAPNPPLPTLETDIALEEPRVQQHFKPDITKIKPGEKLDFLNKQY